MSSGLLASDVINAESLTPLRASSLLLQAPQHRPRGARFHFTYIGLHRVG